MTEVEKARVVVRVDELKKEMDREEFLLALIRRKNSGLILPKDGREICTIDVDTDEFKTGETILELGRKITYLEDCLRDNRNLRADVEMLARKIQEFDTQIETLEIFRKADQDNLKWASLALRVCNGEQ